MVDVKQPQKFICPETHPTVKNLAIALHFYIYCNLMHPSVRANCQVLFKDGNRNVKVIIDQ